MGYRLRMSDEIRAWLADLGRDRPEASRLVGRALVALIREGSGLAAPLVVPASAPQRPAHPLEALDQAYQDRLERVTELRRGLAEADMLATDIARHLADLEAQRIQSEDRRREEAAAGHPAEAAEADAARGRAAEQIAELERLVPGLSAAREVLAARKARLQSRLDAFRTRKETLKARYVAAEAAGAVRDIIATSDIMAAERWQQRAGSGAAEMPTDLREIAEEIERELGAAAPPDGLMELRPAALATPGGGGRDEIVLLFVVEPAGTALLIAVLDGQDAVRDRYRDAIGVCSLTLRRVRNGTDPEASACEFDDAQTLISEFFPGEVFPEDVVPSDVLPGDHVGAGGRSPRTRAEDARAVLASQRSRLGLSTEQIAVRMGVSEQRVSVIEHAEPGAVEVKDLAAYIGALGGSLSVVADVGGERVVFAGGDNGAVSA